MLTIASSTDLQQYFSFLAFFLLGAHPSMWTYLFSAPHDCHNPYLISQFKCRLHSESFPLSPPPFFIFLSVVHCFIALVKICYYLQWFVFSFFGCPTLQTLSSIMTVHSGMHVLIVFCGLCSALLELYVVRCFELLSTIRIAKIIVPPIDN